MVPSTTILPVTFTTRAPTTTQSRVFINSIAKATAAPIARPPISVSGNEKTGAYTPNLKEGAYTTDPKEGAYVHDDSGAYKHNPREGAYVPDDRGKYRGN